jgi:hypothetical protein
MNVNVRFPPGPLRVQTQRDREPTAAYPVMFSKVGTTTEAIGTWHSYHAAVGNPGAWSPGSPGVNGRNTDGSAAADDGCLPIPTPDSGELYLTHFHAAAGLDLACVLVDILWVNTGLAVATTTLQAVASGTLPARDLAGGSTGLGVWAGILVTATTGNAGAFTNCTLDYTNSDGDARTAAGGTAATNGILATSALGTVYWFRLQEGDKGVRSIEGVTFGTSFVSGSVSLILARPLISIGCIANRGGEYSNEDGIRLFDGRCVIPMVIPTATTATPLMGSLALRVAA